MAEHQMYTKEMGPTFINAKGKDCTSIDYKLFQESYREQISSIKKIDVIANVSDHFPILLRERPFNLKGGGVGAVMFFF